MATIYHTQSAFNAGMWGNHFHMRTDLEQYDKAAADATNAEVLPHGPIRRRPGTNVRHEITSYTGNVRLIPFIIGSKTETYQYVLANGKLTVLKSQDVLLVEIDDIPYTDDELPIVQYVNAGRDVVLFHPNHIPHVIRYRSDTAVEVIPYYFEIPPTIADGFAMADSLTLSAVTGTGITATLGGAASWVNSDVGRNIVITTGETGLALITGYTSTTVVVVDILEDFASTTWSSGEWKLSGSPHISLVIAEAQKGIVGEVGSPIDLYFAYEPFTTNIIDNGDFSSGGTDWGILDPNLTGVRDFESANSSDTKLNDDVNSDFTSLGLLPGHLVVSVDTGEVDEIINIVDDENLYVTGGGAAWTGATDQYQIRQTGQVAFDSTEELARLFGGIQGLGQISQNVPGNPFSALRLKFEVQSAPLTMKVGTTARKGDIVGEASFPTGQHEVIYVNDTSDTELWVSFMNNKDVEAQLSSVELTALGEIQRDPAVGDYVYINGGVVRIDSLNGGTQSRISGTILKALQTSDRAPAATWSLERPIYNATTGFPRCGTVFGDRIYMGGNAIFPDKLIGSMVGNFSNFGRGTDDNDSFIFGVSGIQREPLLWMHAENELLAGSVDREFAISGLTQPISPTNINIATPSEIGSSFVQPARAGNLLLFIETGDRYIREFAFNDGANAYVSDRNLLIFIEDRFDDDITRVVYQRRRYPQLYVVTFSGQLFVGTYQRTEGVMGWSEWNVGGLVKEAGRMSYSSNDIMWLAVERNGNTYIEYVDNDHGFYEKRVMLDQAFVQQSGSPFTSVTGLIGHVGETRTLVLDGISYGEVLVDADPFDITPWAASATHIELGINYTFSIQLLRPKFQGQLSTVLVGMQSRVVTFVRASIGGTYVRQDSIAVGTPGTLFTGKVFTECNLGFNQEEDGSLLLDIEQSEPYPLEVQSVARLISFSDV